MRTILITIAILWTALALFVAPFVSYSVTTALLVAAEPDLPRSVVRAAAVSVAALGTVLYTGGAIYYAVNVFGQRRPQ